MSADRVVGAARVAAVLTADERVGVEVANEDDALAGGGDETRLRVGDGVIDGATALDGLYAFRGIVKAVALHFRSQHVDHEAKLVKYLTQQGGTDDVGAGSAQIPTTFVPKIKNVVDLATNAEKAAEAC